MLRFPMLCLVLVLLAGCSFKGIGFKDIESRPATAYDSVRDLAAALGDDLCPDLRTTRGSPHFQSGLCKAGDGLLLSIFRNDAKYRRHLNVDQRGCNGPTVYGPNWKIGVVEEAEAEDVIKGIGGRLVGQQETGPC